MTQEWWSPVEAAALFELSDRRMRDKLESWARDGQKRKRAGKGGGQEYHVSCFPQEIKDQLLDATIAAHPAPALLPVPAARNALALLAAPAPLPAPAILKGWQRRAMDARCALLQLISQLAAAGGVDRAIKAVAQRAASGTLPPHLQLLVPVANARNGKNGGRTLSTRSLYRWRADLAGADNNPVALAPIDSREDPRLPAARRQSAPAWARAFLSCYRLPSKPSVPEALAELAKILPTSIALPSESQCYYFLEKMSAVDRERGRCTGNELRAIKGCRHRDTDDLVPCEVYQCDGHSFKARIAHPVHGKPFHPEVCAVIDAATRMVMGWSAGLSESNQTVADALRHACTIDAEKSYGGIPAIFYTDPGSGNLANVNADPVFGRYARLGITFQTGIVGNSQARGMVERLQRTLWIKSAKQFPTFTGRDMDGSTLYQTTRLVDAQIKATGKAELLPSWPQFLDSCRQAVDTYNHTPHRSLPRIIDADGRKRHMTPAEKYTAHLAAGWVPPSMNQYELDDCFRPRIQVTTRRGEVRVFGNTYYHGELQHHAGETVFVEYEVQDGSRVWVRDPQERLICIAGFEANHSRMFPKAASEVAMDQREARRMAVVERKAIEIREERGGVIDFTPAPQQIDAARAALVAEMQEEQAAKVVSLPSDPRGRWRHYTALKSKNHLNADDAAWVEKYQRSSEYRAFAEVEADLAIAK